MLSALIGVVVGIVLGFFLKVEIPTEFTRYTAVAILGMVDAIFGALRSQLVEKTFRSSIFLSGLVFNVILALGITWLGDRLGLDLYLAATIVFMFRIFTNLGHIRRAVLAFFTKKI